MDRQTKLLGPLLAWFHSMIGAFYSSSSVSGWVWVWMRDERGPKTRDGACCCARSSSVCPPGGGACRYSC